MRDDKERLLLPVMSVAAPVGAAMIRMSGGHPRLGDGLRIAWQRAGRIFGCACIAGTVGLLLRALEERVGWVGRIAVKLIGVFAVVLAAQTGRPCSSAPSRRSSSLSDRGWRRTRRRTGSNSR